MPVPIRCLPNALLLMLGGHAAAQEAPPPARADGVLPQVTVQGRGLARPAGPATVLQADELRNKAAATLGATLQDELGVANASFGPNVGLPVIRGQSGSRVRAMVNGSGAHDASTISADHGVMVEPGLAERITVHRGPSAIQFGGDAIGGAVEVEYERIPQTLPGALRGRAELRRGAGSDTRLARAEGGTGPGPAGLAWHADAHRRSKGVARIRGWAIDEAAVKQQFFLVSGRNTEGHIANSDSHGEGGAVGASAVFGAGFIGASVSTLKTDYGLPPGAHSHSHGGAPPAADEPPEERVRIAAGQRRAELLGEWRRPGSAASLLRLRLADTRYHHDEMNQGVVETRFTHDVREARLEVEHSLAAGHQGTAGVHLLHRDFSALGAEAFVPRTRLRGHALFAVEKLALAPWTLELGMRADARNSRPGPQPTRLGVIVALPERRFHFGNLSVAATRTLGQGKATLTHWRASRAPDVQELYALGPHIATRTYDFGNSALALERLQGWNLAGEQHAGAWSLRANAFQYRVKDHIYQRSLGVFYAVDKQQFRALCAQLDQCLPVTRYEQAHARFHGFEAELSRELAELEAGALTLSAFADQVRGQLVGLRRDLPRQPAARWGLRLEATRGGWAADLRGVRTRAQTRPGENETATAASVQWHACLRWTSPQAAGPRWSAYLVGRNLTDQAVRNSTSFLRNYAPEPGRTLEAGVEIRH
ncbi:MAG: TonB-dependent receptor [Roseateles sp.]|uniref:TonB-dependent receptor n=1 Tax=Roseateles sp. TaxID=1971397 RepID=UPI0039E87D16